MNISENRPTLSWEAAVAVAEGAIREAERLGVKVVATIADGSGLVAAQIRMPVAQEGDVLGGFGVSGASEAQDEHCAQAGLRALKLQS